MPLATSFLKISAEMSFLQPRAALPSNVLAFPGAVPGKWWLQAAALSGR